MTDDTAAVERSDLAGLGGIGREIVASLHALGAHVVGCSRRRKGIPGLAEWAELSRLPELVENADALVLALPGTAHTRHTAALDPGEELRVADLFAQNAGALLDGRPMRNVVDTVHFY